MIIEEIITIRALLIAKVFPSNLKPNKKRGIFNIIVVRPIFKLKSLFKDRHIPRMPPVPIFAGVRSILAYIENRMHPQIKHMYFFNVVTKESFFSS